MNKKEKLKSLLQERKKEDGLFESTPNKSHVRMTFIFSLIMLVTVLIDWIFSFDWISEDDIVLRIVLIIVSILAPLFTWMQYDTSKREEKKKDNEIEKLIDELKE